MGGMKHLLSSLPSVGSLTVESQCVMFFSLQVDRGNLAQAVSDNMLDDLNMNTNGETVSPRDYKKLTQL